MDEAASAMQAKTGRTVLSVADYMGVLAILKVGLDSKKGCVCKKCKLSQTFFDRFATAPRRKVGTKKKCERGARAVVHNLQRARTAAVAASATASMGAATGSGMCKEYGGGGICDGTTTS